MELNPLSPEAIGESDYGWYCVQTKPKSEHIASAHLKLVNDIEVFNPILKFKKPTKSKVQWLQEALFPGYIFVRFNPKIHRRTVLYANAVNRLVEFGSNVPQIPSAIIEQLKNEVGNKSVHEIRYQYEAGDEVVLSYGGMKGIAGIIENVKSGKDRVQILLEFLGQEILATVPKQDITYAGSARTNFLRAYSKKND